MTKLAKVETIVNFPNGTDENVRHACVSIDNQLEVVEAEMRLRQQPNIAELQESISSSMVNTAAAALLKKHHIDAAILAKDTDPLLSRRHRLHALTLDLIITSMEINEAIVTDSPPQFEELVGRAKN